MVDNIFNDYEFIEDIDNDDRLEDLIATSLLLEDRLKEEDIENSINIVANLINESGINIEELEKEGLYE